MTPPLVLDCGAPVFSVAFCGEACLATGGYDERLSLWNLRTKEVRQVAEPPRNDGYAGCIRQISFDSRSRSVTYINPSNQLRRIDPQTFGKNKETLPFHHVVDYSAAQSADIMV